MSIDKELREDPLIVLLSSGLFLVMLGLVEYTSSSSWWRNLKCLC